MKTFKISDFLKSFVFSKKYFHTLLKLKMRTLSWIWEFSTTKFEFKTIFRMKIKNNWIFLDIFLSQTPCSSLGFPHKSLVWKADAKLLKCSVYINQQDTSNTKKKCIKRKKQV